jgi:hypothetical protein
MAMLYAYQAMTSLLDDLTENESHSLAYAASLANKDSMHLVEAMQQSDRVKSVNAMAYGQGNQNHTNCNHRTIYSCEEM